MQDSRRYAFFKRDEIKVDRKATMILLGARDGDWFVYNFNLKSLKEECGATYFNDPISRKCKLSIEKGRLPQALRYLVQVSSSIAIESVAAELE